jgi:dihydroorotase
MASTLIKNARIINEGSDRVSDVLINQERIERIDASISAKADHIIEGNGMLLIPGMIDDQVHFREPGLTHKATISSESMAAVAGGITSFMDMPNTLPNTLTLDLLEEKYRIAANTSLANYSFFMGISRTNMEEALKVDNRNVCGITDDGLYFNQEGSILCNHPDFLEQLFQKCDTLIALHCENEPEIHRQLAHYKNIYGEEIPFSLHPVIRSEQACYDATKTVVDLARKHRNRVHIYHVSTAKETHLFDNNIPLRNKKITAEACIHHLTFTDEDYATLGALIKWNPAVKTRTDRQGLVQALKEGRLDIVATDHAPHTLDEKLQPYTKSMSGGPLVQHALPALLEWYHQGELSLQEIVAKTSHNVAEIYRIQERGYLREGYYADLVLLDLHHSWSDDDHKLFYKCGWSPFNQSTFKSKIVHTWVNGNHVYQNGLVMSNSLGKRLLFEKDRLS